MGESGTCAIYYAQEAYEGDKPRVVGRQSAGAGFLEGWVCYSGAEEFFCFAPNQPTFEQFRSQVGALSGDGQDGSEAAEARCTLVQPLDEETLRRAGCIYQPGPILSETAWMRRYGDERAFSLCGITHSTSTEQVIRGIRDFLIAPLQPWDSLICTSKAARDAVKRIVGSWREYLKRRGFGVPPLPLHIDVIPLGVHPGRFRRDEKARDRGMALREQFGIPPDSVVGLYFGRLDVQCKAHPTPMFRALELAQRRLPPGRLVLLLVGQFPDPRTRFEFDAVRRRLCPSVNVIHIDGAKTEVARDTWFAADWFISLADNIQESFGLTPVEAMAASLPCIVSDWNGYRETVVDGESGFLIPSLMPPPRSGLDLSAELGRRAYDYFSYIGMVSQSTAIDIDRCAEAIYTLAEDGELRQRMGEAGRRRAESLFDWRHIIRRYVELFGELAARRQREQPVGRRDPAADPVHPDYPDPYWLYEVYPTALLDAEQRLELADLDAPWVLEDLRASPIHLFAERSQLDREEVDRIIAGLAEGPSTVGKILDRHADARPAALRTLGWLAKFGLIRVKEPGAEKPVAEP